MRGIPGSIAETVSQHSWETALIAFIIATRARRRGVGVDPYRAATLGVFHDLLEGITGDIPRYTSMLIGELKNGIEEKALSDMAIDEEIKNLIVEWLKGETLEAKIAHVADAVSTYLQSLRYVKVGYFKAMEIASSTRQKALEESKGSVFEDIIRDLISEIEHSDI